MTGDPSGHSVVVIEDDPVFGEALVQRLRLARVAAHWARSAAEGEALLRRRVALRALFRRVVEDVTVESLVGPGHDPHQGISAAIADAARRSRRHGGA